MSAPHDRAEGLAGTRWLVTTMGGQPVPEGVHPTLSFGEDGGEDDGRLGFHGHSGVNRYRGTCTVGADTVEFGPAASTRMAGPPQAMAVESRLLAALSGRRRYERTEDGLEIGEGDSRLVLAEAAPEG